MEQVLKVSREKSVLSLRNLDGLSGDFFCVIPSSSSLEAYGIIRKAPILQDWIPRIDWYRLHF